MRPEFQKSLLIFPVVQGWGASSLGWPPSSHSGGRKVQGVACIVACWSCEPWCENLVSVEISRIDICLGIVPTVRTTNYGIFADVVFDATFRQ